MRWSKFFIPTVKETPADAVAISHVLMVRAGLARQVVAGAYAYLPLGYRVLRKIEAIVREQMDEAGAIELHMSAMQPVDLWRETGREQDMGATLIHLPDQSWRRGVVLGPTHEEIVTDIVRHYIRSYRDVPINLYQIQTKFRDEERAKSGVIRTREFLMKDAYSFNVDKAGLDVCYESMYRAYCEIFERCGLPYTVVEAESGPIGGDASHEFMVVSDGGEDVLAECGSCGYAANIERAECAPPAALDEEPAAEALEEVHTPAMATIEAISGFFKAPASRMIKTLILKDDAGGVVVACVRGDHELNEMKLARSLGAGALEMADPNTIGELTGAAVGFAGPHGVPEGTRIVCDHQIANSRNAITGACRTDYHVKNVNPGRDFPLGETVDIRFAAQGDPCPRCGGADYAFKKCIEIGHVFKLGTKYSDAMGANVLDAEGNSRPLIMGCYGIGLNRLLAAAIETNHDENGIIWPIHVAPYEVEIVALDVGIEEVATVADKLHADLEAAGIEVLLDDRDARPGFKFKDADLIGIPIRVTIGKRGLADGVVEIKPRAGGEVEKVAIEEACAGVQRHVRELKTRA